MPEKVGRFFLRRPMEFANGVPFGQCDNTERHAIGRLILDRGLVNGVDVFTPQAFLLEPFARLSAATLGNYPLQGPLGEDLFSWAVPYVARPRVRLTHASRKCGIPKRESNMPGGTNVRQGFLACLFCQNTAAIPVPRRERSEWVTR